MINAWLLLPALWIGVAIRYDVACVAKAGKD